MKLTDDSDEAFQVWWTKSELGAGLWASAREGWKAALAWRTEAILRCPNCKSADVILIGKARHSMCGSCGHKFTWGEPAVAMPDETPLFCQKPSSTKEDHG